MAPREPARLWTVGHSNFELDQLLDNLRRHEIDAIADVRSWPRSLYAPWFDANPLAAALKVLGIAYVSLGQELGGRPDDDDLYLPDGRVRNDAVSQTASFRKGLDRLRAGLISMRVAVLCAEESPEHCHRRLLVARVLHGDGIGVHHIRGDGGIEDEHGFVLRTGLFGDEELPWASTASVSHRRPRSTSSAG